MKRSTILVAILLVCSLAAAGAYSRDEARVWHLLNAERADQLTRDADLDRIARRHAARMAAAGRIWHSDLSTLPSRYRLAGENVGMGPGVREIHRAFMESSSHRANILDARWTHGAVGVAWEGGAVYVVQLFGRVARQRAPSRPARAPAPEQGRRASFRKAPPRESFKPETRVVAMLVRMMER